MGTKYRLKQGENIRTVARRAGFISLKPFEDEPANASIIAERGGIEKVKGGDRITIPDAKSGKTEIATGMHHTIQIPWELHTLEVRIYSEFRIPDPDAPGDKSKAPSRCKFFGQDGGNSGFFQIDAVVELMEMDPSTGTFHSVHETETRVATNKKELTDLLACSLCELPAPDLGKPGFLKIRPKRTEETSDGPARANPGVAHDIGTDPAPWLGSMRQFHFEYRPLEIDFTIFNQEIFSAEVHGDPAPSRPHHATLFWKNVGEEWGRMILEVDWRPDFLRRVKPSIKPKPEQRSRGISGVIVHHTGGPEMGSQLNTFLNKTKGAHMIIDLDGHVVRVADDVHETRHGGGAGSKWTPNWAGRTNLNDHMVGIENCHGDHDHLDESKNPFTDAQYTALIDVIRSLRDAYGFTTRHVIGHLDASVSHTRCPGPHFLWEKLEAEGQALAPEPLTAAELDAMFGGFYAGADGRTRRIDVDDVQLGGPTDFKMRKSGGVEITGLTAGPITELRQAFVNIGYDPRRTLEGVRASRTKFETVNVFITTLFMEHFCTGSRMRLDQPLAYREDPRIPNNLFIDFELAKLIKEVEKAALANP